MKRQILFLVALLATSSLVGCGGKKSSTTSSEAQSSSAPSSEPSSQPSSSEPSSSSLPPVATGISVNADNVKKDYSYGEVLDLTNLVVNLNYDNGSSTPITNFTTNPANGAALNEHGQQNVVVSYETFTANFSINVNKVLVGISVNADNMRKEYSYGDTLNLAGLEVSANFSDNSSEPVTNYVTDPANGATLNTHGAQNVAVSYQGFSENIGISVAAVPTGIALDVNNTKVDYFLGRALDLEGLVVNVEYSDGSKIAVDNYSTDPAAGTVFNEVGQKTITVSYLTYSKSFSVNVIDGSTPIVVPESASHEDFDNTNYKYPDDLIVNNRIVSVLERGDGEQPAADSQYQLVALPQLGYSGRNATFTSANPDVATVSETGLITGISAGETVVVVADKNNPDFKTEVKVYVSPEIDLDDANDINNNLVEESKAHDDEITAIVDNEMWMRTIYRTNATTNETSLYSYDRWDQRFVASKDDAYFRIWETDATVKAVDGAMDFTNFDWIFHTDEFYETYLFHQSGDVKTYLDVPTQNYLDNENHKRTDPLLDILDNIFNSGKSYFENVFKNARLDGMTDLVGYSQAKNVHYGSRGENSFFLDATIRFNEKSDLDDENRYGIPYGTAEIIDQRMVYTIENNRVVALSIELDETYSYGGYNYHALYSINHTYEDVDENKSQIYVPAFKDYTEVDSIYDL